MQKHDTNIPPSGPRCDVCGGRAQYLALPVDESGMSPRWCGPHGCAKPAMFSAVAIAADQPTRDPALRKAALDADRALARWQGSSTNADYDAFCMAMDALREELAK